MHNVVCNKKIILRFERIEDVLRNNMTPIDTVLTPQELRESSSWKTPRRSEAYLASRILAKEILQSTFVDCAVPLGDFEVLSKTVGQERGKAPAVSRDGLRLPVKISISHTDRMVLVGISEHHDDPFGVDLVSCASPTKGFQRVWFSREEHEAYAKYTDEIWLRSWAVKEAAYKAVNEFIKFTPREICALPENENLWNVRFAKRTSNQIDSLSVKVWKARTHLIACTCELTVSALELTSESTIDNSRELASSIV